MRELEAEGFVLAGGRSRRMGVPKAFLSFQNSFLLQRSIDILKAAGLSVRLVASAENRFENISVPVLIDRIPGAGPLGAIYTALCESESSHCLFIACDTPLVEPDLFQMMMEYVPEWDAVVPLDSKGQIHPLSAYYSTNCQVVAGSLLRMGERRVGGLLEAETLRILRLPVENLGIPDRCFQNVNTLDEYEDLLRSP